jgi:NarL family two-component system response regulator LiaR
VPGPVRIAIVNDYEIVVAGTAAVLAPYADRVEVVELDAQMKLVSDVDVLLYDTFGQVQGDRVEFSDLVEGEPPRVVIFSWNVDPTLVSRAMEKGASGYLSKALTADQLVESIERVHAGEVVLPSETEKSSAVVVGDWPGQQLALSAREAEIIALITQGLTNQEIAERAYLSINSIKSYIRSGYRKIGVTRRSQAVAWGMQNGFAPDRLRRVDPFDHRS